MVTLIFTLFSFVIFYALVWSSQRLWSSSCESIPLPALMVSPTRELIRMASKRFADLQSKMKNRGNILNGLVESLKSIPSRMLQVFVDMVTIAFMVARNFVGGLINLIKQIFRKFYAMLIGVIYAGFSAMIASKVFMKFFYKLVLFFLIMMLVVVAVFWAIPFIGSFLAIALLVLLVVTVPPTLLLMKLLVTILGAAQESVPKISAP